ncbi:hypothetical protein [Streptacidiphilus sp. PB12-B1b]|uniref:hypothetical protein n=1 Tax=Streptacidiphilus sp. PB12-B1b TaxID=2705012 RepID=UPI001CDC15C0|nr:hypothetical protein [Streptacidiphilus sp. PB12-B1b]
MEDLDHSDRPPKRRSLDLSVTQVAASSLAAVAGAVLASELGVYGTLLGAAVVSAGATTGSALFQHAFRRTGEQLRDLASTPPSAIPSQRPRSRRRQLNLEELKGEPSATGLTATGPTPTGPPPTGPSVAGPARAGSAAGSTAPFDPFDPGGEHTRMMAAVAPPAGDESVATYRGRTTWKPRSRKSYALMAVLVFVLAMGTVTVVELVAGKPVAAIVKDEPGSGTSFGGTVHRSGGSGGSGGTDPATGPSGAASAPAHRPSGSGEPSAPDAGGASGGATGGQSSSSADPTPSSTPTPTPSTAPDTGDSHPAQPGGSGAPGDGAETPSAPAAP